MYILCFLCAICSFNTHVSLRFAQPPAGNGVHVFPDSPLTHSLTHLIIPSLAPLHAHAPSASHTLHPQVVIQPGTKPEDSFTITWVVTHGTAISVATTAAGAFDVTVEGNNSDDFKNWYDTKTNPGGNLRGAYEDSTFFFVQINRKKNDPVTIDTQIHQLFSDPSQHAVTSCKKHDDHTIQGCVAQITTHTPEGSPLQSMMNDNVHGVDNGPRKVIQVVYGCKTNGQVDLTLTIRTQPFGDIEFKWSKKCDYTPGFSVATTKYAATTVPDVVSNGEPKPAFTSSNVTGITDPYNGPGTSRSFWIWLNPKEAEAHQTMVMSDVEITSSHPKICAPKFVKSVNDHTFDPDKPGEPIPMDIDYTACNPNVGGITSYNITMTLGGFKHVTISWRKANGHAPGLQIECGKGCPDVFPTTPAANSSNDKQMVVVSGKTQSVWAQDYANPENLPVVENEVWRTEFPIKALQKAYPQSVIAFEFDSTTQSQCAFEQTPANLDSTVITSTTPEKWALDYWCKPMNNDAVPLKVSLKLTNFEPISFFFKKNVRWLADLDVGKITKGDVNSRGTYTSSWGPDVRFARNRRRGFGKDEPGTVETSFNVQFTPNVATTANLSMPVLADDMANSALNHNATDPKTGIKFCNPEYRCSTQTGHDCTKAFFSKGYGFPVKQNDFLKVRITYNCNTTNSTDPVVFSAALLAKDDEYNYTAMQWRWVRYTSPQDPYEPDDFVTKEAPKQVTVSWNAADNGGVSLAHYNLNYTEYLTTDEPDEPTGPTSSILINDQATIGAAQAAALTYVVTGLKNGVKYQFNLNAINIAGKMSDAASADATPEVRKESVECGVD